MYGIRARWLLSLVAAMLLFATLPAGAQVDDLPQVPVSTNIGCDPIDPAACLLPFPNDFFTVADGTTDTGRRVNFNPGAMPRTGTELTQGGEGKPADPTEWNRQDGFSPGSMVMTYVPGIDLHQTWGTQDRGVGPEGSRIDYRDQITDIGLSLGAESPMVIINADTGERHPFWSELDQHSGAVEAQRQVLIIRPAVNFDEGARYIVALRNLRKSDGSVIPTGSAFEAYKTGAGADTARQAHYTNDIFPVLESAGIAKNDLYLAWDFTVASERNLSERILTIRDDAFKKLGDTTMQDGKVQGSSPHFTVDSVEETDSNGNPLTDTWTDSNGITHTLQLRYVNGRVTVPNYLDRIQQTEAHFQEDSTQDPAGITYVDAPAPGSRFFDGNLDGLPDQNPVESTVEVPFRCRLALNGAKNFGVLYGHGLLGNRDQINDIRSPQRNGPFFGCAADWWGMSTPDLPTVAAILTDISHFPSLADRAQQGFLNFMYIGRAMIHSNGFATDPAFQQNGKPLIKVAGNGRAPLFYDGNSQGGIMGGALVAVSPDIRRGILGVLGMNYSTLLNRSVDWEGHYDAATAAQEGFEDQDPEALVPPYSAPFYESYRDPIERQIGFSLLQMLWDRAEANGYAHHITRDPLANTPSHEVMLQAAFGDYQVSNHAAEVEARTIGAPRMTPDLAPGRHWALNPFGDFAAYPYQGSALVYWDSGNVTPPNGNVPPGDEFGDPHSHPRKESAASWQEAQFLLTGWMVDVCGGGYYLTDDNPLNGGLPSCHEPTWTPGSQNFAPVVTAAPPAE